MNLISIVSFYILAIVNCISLTSAANGLTDQTEGLFENAANECSNNSLDGDCHLSLSENTNVREQERRHHHPSKSPLDDRSQLADRLTNVDRLQTMDLDEFDWFNQEPAPTLRQVLILHRHGDRTPIQFTPKDNLKTEPFWAFHGYGQLTNRGKARLYLLGKMLRRRYNKFLDKSVNKRQRISRSSGSLRCIESAQMFCSSFLGLNTPGSTDAPNLVWDQHNNTLATLWQPVNIQSVPVPIDGMLAEGAVCNELQNEYMDVIDKTHAVKKINTDYAGEAHVLSESLGYEMDHFYKWFWSSSQLEVERSYFQSKMKPEILAIYDRVQEAGNLALGAYQSTMKARRLRSGLLINDMINHMQTYRSLNHQVNDASPKLKKFIHYAAHDLTLIVILGMLDLWDTYPSRPDYASSIITELHEDSGEWYIELFYMPQVPSKPIKLRVKNCESEHPLSRCTLDKFAQLMDAHRIDSWQSWMKECRNDLDKLNPYEPGH